MLFLASHKKWPWDSLVIFVKWIEPFTSNETLGSYKKSLYSPGDDPIAFFQVTVGFGYLNGMKIFLFYYVNGYKIFYNWRIQ